ncbi:DUF927 domain-containing protein [Roseivivax sp. CAU 1753]
MKDLSYDLNYFEGIPAGYHASDHGIFIDSTDPEGEEPGQWFCSPIRVIGFGSDATGKGWGILVELRDPQNTSHQVYLPMSVSVSQAAKLLGDRGLRLNGNVPKASQKLLHLIKSWDAPTNIRFIQQLGWLDENFDTFALSPTEIIGAKSAFFNGTSGAVYSGATSSGTLKEWRDHVGSKCIGNPILTMAVSVALAGPFMRFLGSDSFVVHLRGASSSGKTTALWAANSVWSSPMNIRSWRATSNALEPAAASANDMVLALDELGQISPQDACEVAYLIGNGVGKLRARSNGSGEKVTNWKLCALSTGEISLAEKMAEAGQKMMAGQEVRFLDIEADGRQHGSFDDLHTALSGANFANSVKANSGKFYGTAGHALVWYLTTLEPSTVDKLSKFVIDLQNRLVAEAGSTSDPIPQRVAKHMALVALAGEVASKRAITGWPSGNATNAVKVVFHEWLASRDAPTRRMCKSINGFINRHSSELQSLQGATVPNPVGYQDHRFVYLSKPAMSQLVGSDELMDVARMLADRGIFVKDGKHLASKMSRRVPGRERHYKLSRAKLAEFTQVLDDPN